MKRVIVTSIALALLLPMVPARAADIDGLLARVAKWNYDENRDDLLAVSALVAKAQGSAASVRQIEERFIAFLKSDASLGAKDFICRELSVIGSEASVPVLSAMLSDPKTADMARWALERIPGESVNRALREGLTKSGSDQRRIGIIVTLGRRRDAASVPLLRPVALGSDLAAAGAALFALAEIADRRALDALDEAQRKSAGEHRVTASQAYLKAAGRLAPAEALPIYKKLYAAGEAPMVRVGALNGIARTGGARAIPVLMEALGGGDGRLQAAAIQALAPHHSARLIAEMPKLSEAGQVRVLGILAERREVSALPAFTAALESASKPVRMAAIEGVWRVGNASTVPLLAAIAAEGDSSEQAAARNSLARIPGRDVDRAIIDGIATAAPKPRLELIRAAGERSTTAAAPVLLKMAGDADDAVRREALRALRDAGTPDQIPGLVALVTNPVKRGDRTEAVRSLAALLRRSEPGRIDDLLSAYESAGGVDAKTALMQVMAQTGNARVLPVLRKEIGSQDADTKRAAILALGEWPDDTPISDLFAAARAASSPAHQVLALRGALKLIALPSGRPPAASVKLLAEAMSLARQPDEKREALGMLPKFRIKEALDLARTYVDDREVGAEARLAVERLERMVRR